MSEAQNCNHDCGSCTANCDSRVPDKKSFEEKLAEGCSVKKVIGVVSGKGGVGKSLVTSLMACQMRARGYKVGIWRGPVIAGAVKQFWNETYWKDIDYMFVDMPPGTGDVPLTVFQSLPVDGILIVTSPQELVSMIVGKAVNMAKKMDVPIIGLIENMSYLECPDCGKKISVFGESKVEEVGKEYGIPVLAQIPIRPEIAGSVDEGTVEYVKAEFLEKAAEAVEKL